MGNKKHNILRVSLLKEDKTITDITGEDLEYKNIHVYLPEPKENKVW